MGLMRHRPVVEEQITALAALDHAGEATAFEQGALATLRWAVGGGPGPLTGAMVNCPVPAWAIGEELVTAEGIIDGRASPRRDYACGVDHALRWAGHVTTTAPCRRAPVTAPPARSRPAAPASRTVSDLGSVALRALTPSPALRSAVRGASVPGSSPARSLSYRS